MKNKFIYIKKLVDIGLSQIEPDEPSVKFYKIGPIQIQNIFNNQAKNFYWASLNYVLV